MDLWQMVSADHANIRELCREVLRATGGGPNSRANLFEDLDDEVERHIGAMESVLYPALSHHPQTSQHLSELTQQHEEIRDRLHGLAAYPNKNSRTWALDFKELESALTNHFDREEHGVLMIARTTLAPQETDTLRRSFERAKIASLQSRRWHLPEALMPGRYGLSTGTVLGVLGGVVAIGAAIGWGMARQSPKHAGPLRPARRRPEPPFPLQSGVVDTSLERSRTSGQTFTGQTSARQTSTGSAMGREAAAPMPGTTSGTGGAGASSNTGFSSANPPRPPSGLATGLQPGGVAPGGGPGASVGSIGTGGGSTGGHDSGSLKPDGR
ncbi:hemerythrin domain-containing protein [Microvirga aerophila]|uniref:Hemerythrin-like domain-containing protein n=1 Tax=Microvirga aerophila TaxID=670291 RepID=A0A512BR77_9HYPH|nr:hemerythrin domain-containing protein [Microvirga aerophila]GEO14513.1 hypothetical protein MAE02_22090 [Microvirga aerophila]